MVDVLLIVELKRKAVVIGSRMGTQVRACLLAPISYHMFTPRTEGDSLFSKRNLKE